MPVRGLIYNIRGGRGEGGGGGGGGEERGKGKEGRKKRNHGQVVGRYTLLTRFINSVSAGFTEFYSAQRELQGGRPREEEEGKEDEQEEVEKTRHYRRFTCTRVC